MLFDADTHISSERGGMRSSVNRLLSAMDTAGIDKALVWLHPAQTQDEYCDYDAQNEYVFREASRHSDRLTPVGWLNPLNSTDAQIERRIQKLREEYGCGCVKLNGAQNFYDITSPRMMECVLPMLTRAGMALAFHCGNDINTHPRKVQKIASMFPNTSILLVHMGQTACEEAIAAAKISPNIMLVGSGMSDYSYVRQAVLSIGAHRICYGSDFPFANMREMLIEYDSALEGVSDADKALVMCENIARFLALCGRVNSLT